MKRFLKITAIILAVLVVAMIVLPFVFKGKIVEIVKKEINKSVNAKVDFQDYSLSLFRSFPNFSFGLEGLKIIGNQPFESDTLAQIPNLYLTLDLSSVFAGSPYEIKSIIIENPTLKVKVLRDGRANYDIMLEDTSAVAETEPSSFKMSLQKFVITNARVVYDDLESDMLADLRNFDLNMKGDLTASTTDLDLQAVVGDFTYVMEGISYIKHGKLGVDALIAADLDKFIFTFKENEMTLNNLKLTSKGWVSMPEDDIEMDIVFGAPMADFKTLLSLVPAIYLTDMEGLKASGKAEFSGFVKGIYNDVLMPAFGLKIGVENGRFQYPDLPQSIDNVNIKAKILSPTSDFNDITIDVSKFHFSVAKNPMDIILFLKNPISDPNIDAKFKGKLNLSDVQKFYPLEEGMKVSGLFDMDFALKGKQSSIEKEKYNEFQASGFMNLTNMNYVANDLPEGVSVANANMDFSPEHIALTGFNATYKKNNILADGKLMNYIDYAFGDGILVGFLNLKSEFLNIDEMLGTESTSQSETTADTSALEAFMVPENIDFTLTTTLGRIKYDNIDINSLYGNIRIADSRVNLNDLNMEMLGGELNLNGFYSTVTPDFPAVSMVMGIRNFNIKNAYDAFNTIRFFAPLSQYIQGDFSSLLTFNSNLDKAMNPIYKTIDAKGVLQTSALAIKSSPVFAKLAAELKYDKLQNLATKPAMVDFEIIDGNLEVQPFDLMISDIPARVKGTANLDRTIDYTIDMEIPSSKLGNSATAMISNLESQAKIAGLTLGNTETIPVKAFITGQALNPVVKIAIANPAQDLQDQLETAVKSEIKKVKEQAKDEIEKKKKEVQDEALKLKQQAQDSLTNVINKQKAELERKKKEAEEKAKKKLEDEAKAKLNKYFKR